MTKRGLMSWRIVLLANLIGADLTGFVSIYLQVAD
jgi:hypothetical protein